MGKHTKRHKIHTVFISGIAIRQTGPELFMADFMRDGTRTRKSFQTLAEAKTYAQQKAIEIKNRGTSALSISDKLRIEVDEVLAKLNGRATIRIHPRKGFEIQHPVKGYGEPLHGCGRA